VFVYDANNVYFIHAFIYLATKKSRLFLTNLSVLPGNFFSYSYFPPLFDVWVLVLNASRPILLLLLLLPRLPPPRINLSASISMHQSRCINLIASISLHRSHCINLIASISLHQSHCIHLHASMVLTFASESLHFGHPYWGPL